MEIIVGIDFGTTNTIITKFVEPNHFITVKDTIFTKIPSKIGIYKEKIYCGNNIPNNDDIIIKENFKNNISENTELIIIFFKYLYNIINHDNIKAVITVPSNFNDNEREIIKRCFEHVNINVIRIINEPSAGALSYGLNQSLENYEKFLVIDMGGGTTDFSILEKNDLFFEVIYSYGINNLGGNTITNLIMKYMNITNFSIAQNIKEKLTYLDSISNITKNDLNNIIIENNVLDEFKNILENIKKEYNDIKNIILIGGTCKIPYIQETIKDIMSSEKIILYNNIEFAVSQGACIYASILLNKYTFNNQLILVDVLTSSLGVELADGTYSVIIPKNTPLPTIKKSKYTTNSPNNNLVNIKVYQGENKIANNNNLIGNFTFDKISISINPIIEIIFKVDVNSILTITIIDTKTNIDKNIIIKNLPKINDISSDNITITNLEDNELQKIQYIYLIKTFISNYISNLNINNLISNDEKKSIINYFNSIENKINDLSNLELINIYNKLELEFINNITINEEYLNINEVNDNTISDLKNKINNLLIFLDIDNIYHIENLKIILNNIDFNNEKYINDKLKYVNNVNYMIEFNNLCLFLQIEINNNNIINDLLKTIVNEKLLFLNDNKNNDNIDWYLELTNFNSLCEKINNQ